MDREEIFLVTKVWTSNLSHDNVIRSTRESLKKLQTEYIDLLLMHWPNPSVPLEEILGAMTELQEEESVKHVGVSTSLPQWSWMPRGTSPSSATKSSITPTGRRTNSYSGIHKYWTSTW